MCLTTESCCELGESGTFESIEFSHHCFYPRLVAAKELVLGEGKT